MNLPWVYMCSQSWNPLPHPSPYHPSGSSQCTSPCILYHASNLDSRFISHMILYMFQCHSPKSSPPAHRVQKTVLYICVSFAVSHSLETLKWSEYILYVRIWILKSQRVEWGLSWLLSGKESACQAGNVGFIPGSKRSLEKQMTTHSSILAWEILWTEEPGGLQSTGSQKSQTPLSD